MRSVIAFLEDGAPSLDGDHSAEGLLALEILLRAGEEQIPRPGQRLEAEMESGEPPVRVSNTPNWWVFQWIWKCRNELRRVVDAGRTGASGGAQLRI
jgi:hypothetical protein